MTFWAIVLGITIVALLLAWRSDRRRRVGVRADLHRRVGRARGADESTALEVEVNRSGQGFRRRHGWFD